MSSISLKDDVLTLEYNLFDLPTAQHKAGLAGLLVMIESLRRREKNPLPMVEVSPTSAKISFTKESLQMVFDDLYDAVWIETESKQKWKGQEPKRIVDKETEINGKKKKEKRFVYDAVQPKGMFLQTFYSDADEIWIKLWRDMTWSILRGIPATRNIYEERANEKPSSEGESVWQNFQKTFESQKKGKLLTESLASSVFLGAESGNAEKVSFKGTIPHNFLLNFWTIVSLIYVPREMEIKRSEEHLKITRSEAGYVLAIPEPYDLENFVEDAVEVLTSLPPEKAGFRPRAALIDLFQEGGLEYLYQFAKKKTDDRQFMSCLHAVEVYHLQKQGNRIRQLGAERILPNFQMIGEYEKFRDVVHNPFYKQLYLVNLLNGNLWYDGSDAFFHQEPMPIFVYSSKTPKGIRFFGKDVKDKFEGISATIKSKKEGNLMTEKDVDDQLSLRVYRLIQNYIRRRTEEKSDKKYDDFKKNKNDKGFVIYPKEYREALEKICSDAFLAMRGRRDQDFIEYFTGTICSVPQYLPESDYLFVANVLTEDWQKVKTLSMLAISANSYLFDPTDE